MESHFTATGLVLNQRGDRALMIFHKKLQIWLPAGGHVEQGELPHEAVVREVLEETGVRARIIDASSNLMLDKSREIQIPAPRWVLHEPIPTYKDKTAHMHYDFIYCMQSECDACCAQLQEVSQVQWFSADQLRTCDTSQATRIMYLMLLGMDE